MDIFRQWAICLIVSAAAGTFVCAVSPRGAIEKAVRTVAGIFVVVTVCMPLTRLENVSFDIPAFADSYVDSDSGDSLKEHMLESCKSAVLNQLDEIARKYSLIISNTEVNAYIDEYNSIIIQDIQLEINSESPGTVLQFQSEAQDVLGIPVTIRNGILT